MLRAANVYLKIVSRVKMKLFVVIFLACVLLEVKAQNTTTKAQPRSKIPLPSYRPSVSDFQTDFLPISIQSSILRNVEVPGCARLRSYMDDQLKRFHEKAFFYTKSVFEKVKSTNPRATSATSVPEAVTAIKTDSDAALAAFITSADKFIKEINDNCPKLATDGTIRDVNKAVVGAKTDQLTGAFALYGLPSNYEIDMQANYKPLEDVILAIC